MATKNFTIAARSGASTAAPKNSLSRDEWLTALADAVPRVETNQDALTTEEFAVKFGIGRVMAQRKLKQLLAAGRVRQVKKNIVCADGRSYSCPAYLLVK